MTRVPLVSIVLPTYNRAGMLARALESIALQTFGDWELIVVDDGSTDRNREVVQRFADRVSQAVSYTYQENRGAGAARQNALSQTRGKFIAFMDSDDPWLPHHLCSSVAAFDASPQVDWVVSPARVVNELTGEVVSENSFYTNNKPRPHFGLHVEKVGDLNVITDTRFVEHVIKFGFPGGLQTSVVRSWVKELVKFRPYRLFDDNAFRIEASGHGVCVGYFTDPHIIYHVHDQNVSLVNAGPVAFEKRVHAYSDGVSVMLELSRLDVFTNAQKKMLRELAASMVYWDLGYSTYWLSGRRRKAFESFCMGLRLNPGSMVFWKGLFYRVLWPFPPRKMSVK